jgi:lipopolysaccharide export system permease protein
MTRLQRYLLRQVLVPLLGILLALTAIAILTQGLAQLDIIADQRRSALTFLEITLLAVPQLLALILPLAVFFATIYAVNRLLSDSELVVAFAAGMGPWQIIAPIFRLAVMAGLVQLLMALLVQPAAYRELRELVYQIRGDPAAFLVREGGFNSPLKGVTIYASGGNPNGVVTDLLINDARDPGNPVIYTAKTGSAAIVEGELALILRNGQILHPKENGGVDTVDFDQFPLEFAGTLREIDPFVLKPSDLYLGQLFAPNMTYYFDQTSRAKYAAEAHLRLASPLLSPALALIALAFLLTGDFNRRGYGKRMVAASVIALAVRLATMGVQSAARDDASLNVFQYLIPLVVMGIAVGVLVFSRRGPKRRRPPPEALAAPLAAGA